MYNHNFHAGGSIMIILIISGCCHTIIVLPVACHFMCMHASKPIFSEDDSWKEKEVH